MTLFEKCLQVFNQQLEAYVSFIAIELVGCVAMHLLVGLLEEYN
jgi:hypothetical protein